MKRVGILTWILGWGVYSNARSISKIKDNLHILQKQNQLQDKQIKHLAKFLNLTMYQVSEAYSASIYIPAKSELMATLLSITRSQFFIEYNFNYTNVSNFLVWYKLDFAKLTNEEIKTLKAKVLKLPTMSMEMFGNVLENIDENYPLSLFPTLILALLVAVGVCVIVLGIIFIWYKRKASLTTSTVGNLTKLFPSLNNKVPTLNSLLPILSELRSSKNKNKTIITPATVSKLSQTSPDELILPPVLIP